MCTRLRNARDLHVAEEWNRIMQIGLVFHKDAASAIEAGMEVRIGMLQEGQFGARRQTSEQRVKSQVAVGRRAFLILEEIGPAWRLDAKRAYLAMAWRKPCRGRGCGCSGAGWGRLIPEGSRCTTNPLRAEDTTARASSWVATASPYGHRMRFSPPRTASIKSRSSRQTGSPSAVRMGRPRPTSTMISRSVSSIASLSAKMCMPTRWLQPRRQVEAMLATTPVSKVRLAVVTVGTSRPGNSGLSL